MNDVYYQRKFYEEWNDFVSTFIYKKHEVKEFQTHFHSSIELCRVTKNIAKIVVSGEEIIAHAGEIVVCNPLETHTIFEIKHAEAEVLIISQDLLSEFFAFYPEDNIPHHLKDVKANERIFALLNGIEPSPYPNKDLSPLKKKALTSLIMAEIVDTYGTIKKYDYGIINDIVLYIMQNHCENLSLASCAEKFHYSKNSLSRIFATRVGIDFRVFLNNVRAEHVNQLMSSEQGKSMTIIEMAYACGFNSEATFYRAYKRRFHTVPTLKNKNYNNEITEKP